MFVCADGLTGLGQAIEAAFPKAVRQTCVVHLIRSALRFVTWGDRKLVSAALRPVYSAESEQAAELAPRGRSTSVRRSLPERRESIQDSLLSQLTHKF